MGYSVDIVSDLKAYRKKIEDVVYTYSFIDLFLFEEDEEILNYYAENRLKTYYLLIGLSE